ncbi:reverse transcriptase domain-containing protein [Tanacetum coccineum]
MNTTVFLMDFQDSSKYQSLRRIKKRLPSPVLFKDAVWNEYYAYRRMPFGLCNAPATFQRCMTAIFHDMVKDFMKFFMDDFSVFGNSFDCCLANLDRMLARCEETNLVLNWGKGHFMVKEGIVLGHKISRAGIEVYRAKIDVITKLPYPTNVKGVRSFLGHAGFYRRFIKDFSIISKPMTQLLMKDMKFDFSDDCKKAFNILKEKLTTAPIIISPDWNTPFELMCDARDEAYENTRIYKERTKRWHDSRLRGDKDFKAENKVLLFNSRFKMHPGKLKSKWYYPNVVKTVHLYGTVEIIDKNGISFKVNGQRLKKYHDGYNNEEKKEVIELNDDTS